MMRPNLRRHALVAFSLALAVGVGLWYVLAAHRSARLSKFFPQADAQPQVRFVPCGLVEKFTGLPNTKEVLLRAAPSDDATMVAAMQMSRPVELLGATRDFLHVRYPADETLKRMKQEGQSPARVVEGWARWGEIIAEQSAVVLDAETGAVVKRLLFPYWTSKVIFSPDGQRAIFYGSGAAREVLTSDYSTARCLAVAPSFYLHTLFYQPDGALYAVVFAADEPGRVSNTQMSIVRVSPTGDESQPVGISLVATGFLISDDGRTGFILHETEYTRREMEQVDVVDLQTFKIRNNLKVYCDKCTPDFTINNSGSELYLKPLYDPLIRVIDTRTGDLVRTLPSRSGEWMPFGARVIGDALYFEDTSASFPRPHVLLNSEGRTKVDPLTVEAIETGGARFNLNRERTHLVKLDAGGKILDSFPIERPEVKLNPEAAHYVFADGLTATPDSKRLLLFVSYSAEARATMECSPTRPHAAMKH